jgi:hypothetical protein
MNYEQMVEWAKRIKERCFKEGKTEHQTRSEIFNSALVQFSDDFDNIDDKEIQLANQVVAAVLPGAYTSAVIATN